MRSVLFRAAILVNVSLATLAAVYGLSDAYSGAACPPAGARILARHGRAVVYERRAKQFGSDVIGCLGTVGKRVKLASVYSTFSATATVHLITFAGTLVALERQTVGKDYATDGYFVVVADLRSGRLIHDAGAGLQELVGPQGNGPLTALVLDRHGNIAWIDRNEADGKSAPPGQPYEVWKIVGRGSSPILLDQGTSISPDSLRLSGEEISWSDGGRRVTSTL